MAWPLKVVRLKEAVPPKAQAEMNSLTDAKRKWEFNLDDISVDNTNEDGELQPGSLCELLFSYCHQQPESHHGNHCNLGVMK